MALVDLTWYCNSVGYAAVALRPNAGAVAAGAIRRQFTAPAVGSERCFVCIVAGTTAAAVDATWVLTRGAKTVDGTATWQECTGQAALNGDLTNTATWAQVKAATLAVLGQIIKRSNGASYQICTTAGAMSASEPAFSDTAGVTTTDTTAVWTSLGPVGNFTGGQAPHARLANALTPSWFTISNTLYVADNHAESQSTSISTGNGPTSGVSKILCYNSSGSYPPAASDLRTGATITTTAASANITINLTAQTYIYGLMFQAGSGASTGTAHINLGAASSGTIYDNCLFQTLDTATGSKIFFGGVGASSSVTLNNTSIKFGHTGHTLDIGALGHFVWQNTSPGLAAGSAVPTALFSLNNAGSMLKFTVEAVDLSVITGNLVQYPSNLLGDFLFKDCKLNASFTIGTIARMNNNIQFVRCDSGATGYKSTRYVYEGIETTETSITRVGGAVDPTGQAQSRKIVTSTFPSWLFPFKAEPYAVWNPTTGANVTVTVCGTVNAGSVPNNDDIWLEVEYLGDNTSPLGDIVTTTKASVLAANAAVSSDSSVWGTPSTTFDGPPTSVTVSNGGLTVTHGNTTNNVGVMSTAALDAGKYYFEITTNLVAGTNSNAVGIMAPSGSITSMLTSNNFAAQFGNNTTILAAGVTTGVTIGAAVSGDVIGIAVDLTARLGWMRRNNGNWNANGSADPATGVGGIAIGAGTLTPVVRFTGANPTDAMTANFGQSAYANAAPSGFLSWDTGWTPFKLTTTLSSPQPQLAGYLHARIRAAKPSTTFYIDPQVVLS